MVHHQRQPALYGAQLGVTCLPAHPVRSTALLRCPRREALTARGQASRRFWRRQWKELTA